MRTFTLSILCMMMTAVAISQDYTQTIRGRVTDADTRQSLPGAGVMLVQGDSLIKSVTTDMEGYYRMEQVPVGRVHVRVVMIGFKTREFPNLELSTAKELVLDVEMEESVMELDEVKVNAGKNGEVLNDMATVSIRSFSVEESQRFAGARNDVARMASNFAGVNTANDATNDIVVRGNSPQGILWRLEEIDIFNPNHFGAAGATGGPVSMLNNNNLRSSDFLTGAFPAMYGNATSGVFDLRMRNGNNQKHEFLGQIGFNGFELGAEGPLSREKRSSYMVNYRYSALGLMQDLGLNPGTGTGVPYYQDVSFKLNFPETKLGHIAVFGLAGKNSIAFKNSDTPVDELEDDFYTDGDQDLTNANHMAVVGLSQLSTWGDKTYSKLILSTQLSNNSVEIDSLAGDERIPVARYRADNDLYKVSGHFYINHKANARNKFRTGVMADHLVIDYLDSLRVNPVEFQTLTDVSGSTNLMRGYVQWKHLFSDDLILSSGLYSQYFALNDQVSLEPRLGLEWKFSDRQSVTFGAGVHNRLSTLDVYFRETPVNGEQVRTNKDLGFTRSTHGVLGYQHDLGHSIDFKVETYVQFIDRAPVERHPSTYSMLNAGTFDAEVRDSITAEGTGRNYGLDITVQQRMRNGNYFILNASLYNSKYRGSDDVLRNTAFNGNYLVNGVVGKEINLTGEDSEGKNKKLLTIDTKATLAGGLRYTAVDLEASRKIGRTVLNEEKPYNKQFKPYFRWDVRIGYKVVYKKFTQEWAFDIQNVTDTQNAYAATYDWRTGRENISYQLGVFPMMQYRITF